MMHMHDDNDGEWAIDAARANRQREHDARTLKEYAESLADAVTQDGTESEIQHYCAGIQALLNSVRGRA